MKNINSIRLTVLAAVLVMVLGASGRARAAADDQLVFMTCQPDICNFGSTSSAGTAIVDLVVGSVSMQANGLTALTAEHYVVWLTNREFTNFVYVADLPAAGQLPQVTVVLPNKDYTHVIITVEADGAVPAAPSARRAMGGELTGVVPAAAVPAVAATAAPVGSFDANAAGPQDLFLSYMPDVCPEGVQTGVGTGVANLGTGEFSVQTSGLDAGAGQKLSLWLLGPNLENSVYIADLDAGGQLQPVFVSIPAATYRYLMITYEAEGAAVPATRGPCAMSAVFANEAVLGTAVVGAALEPTAVAEVKVGTIVETAVADGRFTTLVAALKAASLVETLSGAGPFTVFAPTDDAFAKLPAGTVEGLLKPENKQALTDTLLYHVVSGKVMAADVIGLTSASTLLGKDVAIKVDLGNVYINDAKVIITDIETSNGVIHVVDTVILPPAEVPAIADTELPVKLPETGAILPDGWAGRGVGLLLLVLGVGVGGSALRRKVRKS